MIVTRHCEVSYPSRWSKQGSYATSERQLLFKGEISGLMDATVTHGIVGFETKVYTPTSFLPKLMK